MFAAHAKDRAGILKNMQKIELSTTGCEGSHLRNGLVPQFSLTKRTGLYIIVFREVVPITTLSDKEPL
jgi:hypothetical protein